MNTNELKAHDGFKAAELIEPRFIIKALRSLNYTNYTALLDIIDNSIDAGAENIYVDFDTYRGKNVTLISSILVCDDGKGMNYETLVSALHLGTDNGKDCSCDFGHYGAGLKTASISIGTRFDVLTKEENGELLKAVFDISPLIEGKDEPCASIVSPSEEDNNLFVKYCGGLFNSKGTIIKISNLDKLSCKNLFDFSGTLSKHISETYNKQIYNNVFKIFVNGKHCEFIDVTGNILGYSSVLGNDEIVIDGYDAPIIIKSYYLPEDIVIDPEKSNFLKRTKNNSGIYVYRNSRLVGRALNWGTQNIDKHSLFNGFRCELFFLGEHDDLFGVSFSKMLDEGSSQSLSQELSDKITNTISPLTKIALDRDKSRPSKVKTSEENSKIYKGLENIIANKRQLMGIKFITPDNTGKKLNVDNATNDISNIIKKSTQKTAKPPIVFQEKFNLDERDMLWDVDRDNNGREIITINANHPYYADFFVELNDKQKQKFAALLASFGIAKTKCNYWLAESNSDIRNTIDSFEFEFSNALRTIIQNI